MDFYQRERNVAYGALDFDITESTYLSLAAAYQELNRDGIRWGGLPAFYSDGTRTNFRRSLTISSDWTYWNVDSKAFFVDFKQKLFDDVALNVAYSYRRDDKESALLYLAGRVDKATNKSLGAISVYSSNSRTDENNLDVYLSAPFTIADRKQEIVLGASWNKSELVHSRFGTIQGRAQGTNDLDINTPNQLDFSNMNTTLLTPITNPNTLPTNETTQSGFYIAGKFHLLDPLKLVTGARLSNWEYQAEGGTGNRKFENEITPYVGLVYDVAKAHSVYVSYTDMFKPQNRRDINNNYLDPSVGRNYETGLKSEWLDGRLNTALSIFRIEQSNFATGATNANGTPIYIKNPNGTNSSEQAYYGADGVVSKGVELEVDGEINEHWDISFGIANFEAKDAKDQKVLPQSARTTSNLFLKYHNDIWDAGFGVNYRSKTYSGSGVNIIEQGDIYLFSAMLGYQIDPNLKLQLNVDNILDKRYYDGLASANGMNYGDPRNANLSLRYKF